MVAAFAVGIGSAAIVHLLFGSPAGRLTLDQVADALAELGVEATGLRQAPLEPRGVAIATAQDRQGRSLQVKIYGRDAWDGQLLASAWSSLWYRGDTPHLVRGRREQVEHEAFVTLLAERAGVAVLPVVAAGMASERDALLVTEATGRPLHTLDPHQIDDQLLEGIWGNAARLHTLGVAHRQLDAARIVVRPDGTPAFGDFGAAAVAAADDDIAADRAQVLVATALGVGPRRAAAAAAAALGTDDLQQVLPLLQPAAFERPTRHAVAERDWDLEDLRTACADAAGAELPKLAQLRRVSIQSIGVVLLIALVAYAIISSLANVGLANLIDEFAGAGVAADDADTATDRAQALVATALAAGPERAAAAALAGLGSDALQQVLPLLQPAVVERPTRHEVAAQDWDFEDLRKACAAAAGVELPKLAQLRRVSLRSLGVAALIVLVVYALISALAEVGLANLIEEFKAADFTWLAVALALSPVVPVAQAVATLGASFRPLRFGPVLMLEYAIQFIALAVPSSAARLALDVRFFGRNGIDGGGALSIGVIASVCGFIVQVLLIVLISLSGLASLDLGGGDATATSSTSDSSSSDGYPLLVLTAVLMVVGVAVTLAVPRYRNAVTQAVPRYRAMLRAQASSATTALRVLRSPSKVAMIFAGNLGAQLLQAVILGLCLRAFGHHATMAELILVNNAANLFAGFMPVPGGMGVAEAAYTAGLVALGVPSAPAMSTAIAFRMVTYYLPPIWGAMAMRWLRQHSFI